jgi:Asp-tRNA(Asn)/Glu-tRNA(Gln) amidotransferase A subunit family amidase
MPVGEVNGLPVGLSIIGVPGSDEMLLALVASDWCRE